MKNLRIIDEEEIFKVNQNPTIKYEVVGDYGVLIIDDFYENPDEVRKLALTIPSTLNSRVRFSALGRKVHCSLDMSCLASPFWQIATRCFPGCENFKKQSFIDSFNHAAFVCNIIEEKNALVDVKVPHCDGMVIDFIDAQEEGEFLFGRSGIAAICGLNTPEECAGGTSFYSFEGMQQPDYDYKNRINEYTEYVTDSSDQFELIAVIPMKYNRLVMYNSFILHSGYIKVGMGFDGDPTYRINQIIVP